jgi:hypothetical protein
MPRAFSTPWWRIVVVSVWMVAFLLTAGAFGLTVIVTVAQSHGLLWLAAPLLVAHAVGWAILSIGTLPREWVGERPLGRLGDAAQAAMAPLWIGTLAAFAIWSVEGWTEEDARLVLILATAFAAAKAAAAGWADRIAALRGR